MPRHSTAYATYACAKACSRARTDPGAASAASNRLPSSWKPRRAIAESSAWWVGKYRRGAPCETPALRAISRSPSDAGPSAITNSTPTSTNRSRRES